MSERISTAMGVSHDALDLAGVFDRIVDIDSRLHVDPHLLATSTAPEMRAAALTLEAFWEDAIHVLQGIFDTGDRLWREAVRRFTFPENANVGLGYARSGTSGSAVGPLTAKRLVETALQIVRAGVVDPKIFELVGLFEPNVGPDLISDITLHITARHVLEYTQRVCHDLSIATVTHTMHGVEYSLPSAVNNSEYLLLLPKDILRDLPIAFCWEDIDKVCEYNNALRARLNSMIGENWRRAFADHKKENVKRVLLENPEAIVDLVRQYRTKPGTPYDFGTDSLGETIWLEAAREAAAAFPLTLQHQSTQKGEALIDVVRTICGQFRHLVENCGLSRVFWTEQGQVRHERFAQLLFFAVADAYSKANNLDISPEANSGRGPVDFKFSSGYSARVLVEVKWSKNSKLLHGFHVQLEEYAKAESTNMLVFLVIQVADSSAAIDKILQLRQGKCKNGERAPDVYVVDGRPKDSASHFASDE